jgi:uncharacterized protein (TIGR03382 family)
MRIALMAAIIGLIGTLGATLNAQSPVLNYQFNETAGTTASNSGSTGAANNGTFSAAPNWIQPGMTGSGAVTPGASVTMQTGYAFGSLGAFTLEAWVRTTANDLSVWMGSSTGLTDPFYWYQQASGRVSFFASGTGGAVRFDGDLSISDGQWHHIAFTYDGNTDWAMYINGQEDTGAVIGTGTLPLVLGATASVVMFDTSLVTAGAGIPFEGSMDDFRLWDVERTPQQIADNYAQELGQAASPIMNVLTPDGDFVETGGDHEIDPVAPGGMETFDWVIRNVHPTASLNITTVNINNVNGGTVTVNAGGDPSGTSVTGGGQTTLSLDVTGNAGIGLITFDISIGNDDPNRNPYTLSVTGSRGLTGNFTIDNAGGADYDDLGEAFDDLNLYGVADDVVFTVHDNGTGYTADARYELGSSDATQTENPLRGSPNHSIRFEAATGVRPRISGTLTTAIDSLTPAGAAPFGATTSLLLTNVHNLAFEGFEFAGLSDSQVTIWQEPGALEGGPISFERNLFHDNLLGKALVAFGQGLELEGIVLENNMITDMGTTGGEWSDVGVNVTGQGFVALAPGMAAFFNAGTDSRLEHNSFLLNDHGSPQNSAACISMAGGLGIMESVSWNIFSTERANTRLMFHDEQITGAAFPNSGDYNIWHFPTGMAVFSNEYVSLQLWRNATSFLNLDVNSFTDDPEFVDTTAGSADLHLQGSSPAIGAATGSTLNIDFDGDTRPQAGARDIGADERLGGGTGPGGGSINITTGANDLPDAIEAVDYDYASVSTTSNNTSGTYNWSITAGPAWVDIGGTGPTGQFSGTPGAGDVANGVTITVMVEDAADPTINASRTFTIDVLPAGTMVISSPASLPNGVVGQAYGPVSVTVIGGSSPYNWEITTGPSWLTISGTGSTATLGGTVGAPATSNISVTIQVTSGTDSTTANYSFNTTNPPLPGGSSSGGGGGGCAAGGGSGIWLIALAAIGAAGLLRRRRREVAA